MSVYCPLLGLLGIPHRHLQGVALAPGLPSIPEVLHHLLIPCLESWGKLTFGGSLVHFYWSGDIMGAPC